MGLFFEIELGEEPVATSSETSLLTTGVWGAWRQSVDAQPTAIHQERSLALSRALERPKIKKKEKKKGNIYWALIVCHADGFTWHFSHMEKYIRHYCYYLYFLRRVWGKSETDYCMSKGEGWRQRDRKQWGRGREERSRGRESEHTDNTTRF